MLDDMIMNGQDKEALVIDLLNKGHTTREIAKQARVSFTDIKKIRMKATGEVSEKQQEDQKRKPLSIPSQAFKLFLEGKSIVQVAIGLDLTTEQILKIHSDYLVLQNRGKIASILEENRNNPNRLLETLHYLKENRIGLEDLKDIADIKKNINDYKMERDQLELDTFNAKETLKYHQSEINELRKKRYI